MARERYLLDNEESTIHANQIVPTTAKEKRANWWYHYKGKLIAGVILGAVLISLIWTMLDRENPDYKVMIATQYEVPQTLIYDLEDHFAQYADDRNGDGKIEVSVENCMFDTVSTDSYAVTELQSAFVRFAADAGAGESMIFIYDDPSYEFLSQDGMDGFFGPVDDTDNEYYLWGNLVSLSQLELDQYSAEGATSEGVQRIFSTLKIAVRSEQGDAFLNDEMKQYRLDSIEMYKRMMDGTKTQ